MIQTILFLLLSVLMIGALIGVIVLMTLHLTAIYRKKPEEKHVKRLKMTAIFLAVVMILNLGLIVFSQFTASTPQINDEDGNTPSDSIAELIELELNGRKQWVSLRGWDKNKPVLLFLAGGPGGSQLSAVRHNLSALEKHFVIANWDQPGSAKSYYADEIENITTETYIKDGYSLTEYLIERFGQKKIYLMGESWGSALGVFLIDRYPGSYHAFIGTGQMIDFAETERMDYIKAMELAEANNDTQLIRKMEENGVPPYYGKGVAWKSAVYINYLSKHMPGNPEIHNPGYDTIRDIVSPEYGLIDKINFLRGILDTYTHVYQQLYTIDLREDYDKLDVPIYFFLGLHDINAPAALVEEYMKVLEVPEKEIVWFEHSGHSPWINESGKFVEEVLIRFTPDKVQN